MFIVSFNILTNWIATFIEVLPILGKTSMEKNVFFRALPESPKPPPPDPNSGNLVLFFGRQKRRFARMTEIFFDDDNDGFNDNYDDNFGNFDDNYDKND